jgi:hypothetical protein
LTPEYKKVTTTVSMITTTSVIVEDDLLSNIVYNDYESNDDEKKLEDKNKSNNEINSNNNNNNLIDWKDKRRHFLTNAKDYLKLQLSSSSCPITFYKVKILTLIFLIISFVLKRF